MTDCFHYSSRGLREREEMKTLLSRTALSSRIATSQIWLFTLEMWVVWIDTLSVKYTPDFEDLVQKKM